MLPLSKNDRSKNNGYSRDEVDERLLMKEGDIRRCIGIDD